MYSPVRYEGLVFRPPSEADSLIIQATIGCSNNFCDFCYSYKMKKFRIRPIQEVLDEISDAKGFFGNRVRKVFFADGDALACDNDYLLELFNFTKAMFPQLQSISLYATAKNVLERKNPLEELIALKKAGLKMIYLGIESGDDVILKERNKHIIAQEQEDACKIILEAGIELSVTIIIGLGGVERWRENAIETGKIISRIAEAMDAKSKFYVGALTLMVPSKKTGFPVTVYLAKKVEKGEFKVLNSHEILKEMHLLIENINTKHEIIFRSNHASNYLPIKADLPQDKERVLRLIDDGLKGNISLRPEFIRGL
ncbi:MAG: radical SAM protein [Candidatus Lokiarchaeota archaeon]|nr:radical SAM protein [Candidatus Lokiarchaeota archaeon]